MHVRYRNEVLVRGTLLLKDKITGWVPWGTISRLLTEQSPPVNRPCLTCPDDGVTWGQTLCVCPFLPLPQRPGRRLTAFAHPQVTQHAADPLLTGYEGHSLGLSPLASHWSVGQIKNLGPLCKDDQSSAFSIPKSACNVQLKLSVSSSAPPTQWHFLHKDEEVAHFFYLSFTTMYRQQHRIKKLFNNLLPKYYTKQSKWTKESSWILW